MVAESVATVTSSILAWTAGAIRRTGLRAGEGADSAWRVVSWATAAHAGPDRCPGRPEREGGGLLKEEATRNGSSGGSDVMRQSRAVIVNQRRWVESDGRHLFRKASPKGADATSRPPFRSSSADRHRRVGHGIFFPEAAGGQAYVRTCQYF